MILTIDTDKLPRTMRPGGAVALAAICREPGLSMSKLARRMNASTANATSTVDRLEKRGLAMRIHHDRDRRVILVEPTSKGRALAAEIFPS